MQNTQKLQTSHFAFITSTGRNSQTIPALQKQIEALEQLECFMNEYDGFTEKTKKALFAPATGNSMGGTLEFLRLIVKNARSPEENCKLDTSYIDTAKFEQSIINSVQSKEQNAELPLEEWRQFGEYPM